MTPFGSSLAVLGSVAGAVLARSAQAFAPQALTRPAFFTHDTDSMSLSSSTVDASEELPAARILEDAAATISDDDDDDAIRSRFPNAMPQDEFLTRCIKLLSDHGYSGESTLLVNSLGSGIDEPTIAKGLEGSYGTALRLENLTTTNLTELLALRIPEEDGGILVVYGPCLGLSSDGSIQRLAPSTVVHKDVWAGGHSILNGLRHAKGTLAPAHYQRLWNATQNLLKELAYVGYESQDALLRESLEFQPTKIAWLGGLHLSMEPGSRDYVVPLRFEGTEGDTIDDWLPGLTAGVDEEPKDDANAPTCTSPEIDDERGIETKHDDTTGTLPGLSEIETTQAIAAPTATSEAKKSITGDGNNHDNDDNDNDDNDDDDDDIVHKQNVATTIPSQKDGANATGPSDKDSTLKEDFGETSGAHEAVRELQSDAGQERNEGEATEVEARESNRPPTDSIRTNDDADGSKAEDKEGHAAPRDADEIPHVEASNTVVGTVLETATSMAKNQETKVANPPAAATSDDAMPGVESSRTVDDTPLGTAASTESESGLETDGIEMPGDDHLSWMTAPNDAVDQEKIPEGSSEEKRIDPNDGEAFGVMELAEEELDDDDDDEPIYVSDTYLLGEQIAWALETAGIDVVGLDDDDAIAPALAEALLTKIESDARDRGNYGWNQFGAETLYSIGESDEEEEEDDEDWVSEESFLDELLPHVNLATEHAGLSSGTEDFCGDEMELLAHSVVNIIENDYAGDATTTTTVAEIPPGINDPPVTSHRYVLPADGYDLI